MTVTFLDQAPDLRFRFNVAAVGEAALAAGKRCETERRRLARIYELARIKPKGEVRCFFGS